eukprot:g637.t1
MDSDVERRLGTIRRCLYAKYGFSSPSDAKTVSLDDFRIVSKLTELFKVLKEKYNFIDNQIFGSVLERCCEIKDLSNVSDFLKFLRNILTKYSVPKKKDWLAASSKQRKAVSLSKTDTRWIDPPHVQRTRDAHVSKPLLTVKYNEEEDREEVQSLLEKVRLESVKLIAAVQKKATDAKKTSKHRSPQNISRNNKISSERIISKKKQKDKISSADDLEASRKKARMRIRKYKNSNKVDTSESSTAALHRQQRMKAVNDAARAALAQCKKRDYSKGRRKLSISHRKESSNETLSLEEEEEEDISGRVNTSLRSEALNRIHQHRLIMKQQQMKPYQRDRPSYIPRIAQPSPFRSGLSRMLEKDEASIQRERLLFEKLETSLAIVPENENEQASNCRYEENEQDQKNYNENNEQAVSIISQPELEPEPEPEPEQLLEGNKECVSKGEEVVSVSSVKHASFPVATKENIPIAMNRVMQIDEDTNPFKTRNKISRSPIGQQLSSTDSQFLENFENQLLSETMN